MMDNTEFAPSGLRGPSPVRWGEKRYYSLDYYLKQTYGRKLYKIALDGGMTCPNRDGSLGYGGCIFCSEGGSGDFAGRRTLPVSRQLAEGRAQIRNKYKGEGFIAYFQAYTGTYGSPDYLRRIFTEAVRFPGTEILSIATRPDCLPPEILSLLEELASEKPVWVELGLQTIHPQSAAFIRRGYDLSVFDRAVRQLRRRNISVIVHTILGLPTENRTDMAETIRYLNRTDIQGIKLQLLHILEGTDLAAYYRKEPFHILSMEEYFSLLGLCLDELRPDIVIHRLTGDGPKSLLIEPKWTADKKTVLNQFHSYLKRQNLWQGRSYTDGGTIHTL